MEQNLQTGFFQQGDLVTLQCPLLSKNQVPCLTEHSVYWFRARSVGFHPGIIYIQRNVSDKDVERSCSYSLYVRDSYNDGTHFCAAVACGAILSAEETNLKTGMSLQLSSKVKSGPLYSLFFVEIVRLSAKRFISLRSHKQAV